MKIAFAEQRIYAYALKRPDALGGAERQQWLLARSLAAIGWSVVVGIRDGLNSGERKTIDRVEFIGMGPYHSLLGWRRLLVTERPDWCYWRTADHLLGPAFEIAKFAKVRTIFAAAFDTDVQPSKALSRRRRWWPLYAWGLERSDRILLQHEGQLELLPARWRSKAAIVPSIAPRNTGMKLHCEREKYVAWVGVMREPKRPDLLIEIAQKAPDLQFVVCGGSTTHRSRPGYGEQILQRLRALPNVDYRGQVSPDAARQMIADASVYLLTSDEEGFPNTFLEAWSSGTPVVSVKVDPDGVIQRKQVGLLSSDLETATADLRALISSPELREKLAVRSRQHVTEAHSEAKVMAALRSTLEDGACV